MLKLEEMKDWTTGADLKNNEVAESVTAIWYEVKTHFQEISPVAVIDADQNTVLLAEAVGSTLYSRKRVLRSDRTIFPTRAEAEEHLTRYLKADIGRLESSLEVRRAQLDTLLEQVGAR
jgi:hypothetical protein